MASALFGRDIVALSDLSPSEVRLILDHAHRIKDAAQNGQPSSPLKGKAVAVILQKPSLRTRVSFEVAISRLGAHPVVMTGDDSAFSRGETAQDTIRVLERYVDAVVIRTFSDELVRDLAFHARVPIVNALTDGHHPCQGLADLLTIEEKFGRLAGLSLAYVGDGSNNMAHTYLDAGALTGMNVTVVTPDSYQPDSAILAGARRIAEETGGSVKVTSSLSGAHGADIVVTDTWASMGQEAEHTVRSAVFMPYQVTTELMNSAASHAIFMHCLPAHRGEEVDVAVIDGPKSVIYDEAENRLHAQQAVLSLLLDSSIEG